MSQGDLATALEVSRQAVSKWENDLASPDTLRLIRLAEVLETEVEYLATGVMPVYEHPIVVNLVNREPEPQIVEKPVVRRIIRTQYRRNPLEYGAVALLCFFIGLLIGLLLGH